ncbi:hypothetical protein [Ruminococcus sp.]|uniref:hypothetical protein n=1 Tax=Ruminococcus sp. TaxID=41978 RepID=UPI0025E0E561|nr:hypothetical protein [Ruminococcus sp.]MBQ8966418.1 hypothetical protein [Ruminococcus sp.]
MKWLFPLYICVLIILKVLKKPILRRFGYIVPTMGAGRILFQTARIITMIILFFGIIATAMISLFTFDYWLIFSSSRISQVEQTTGIIITEDVTPKKYKRYFAGPDGPGILLELATTLDKSDFLDNCCSGEKIEKSDISDTNKCFYKYKGHEYTIIFSSDKIKVLR